MEPSNRQLKRRLSDLTDNPPGYSEVTLPLPTNHKMGDSDLMSAAEVLTLLTRSESTPPHDFSEYASTVASPMLSTSLADLEEQQHPIVLLVIAVSKHPIVTNAVRYYELSKRNYSTFNYAAEMVEKAAMPVFSKIEVNLNSIHQARLEEARMKKKRRISGPKERTEIKRRLKFCLHILKLANDNISSKVVLLQQKIQDRENDVKERRRELVIKEEMSESVQEKVPEASEAVLEKSETAEPDVKMEDTSEPVPEAQETKTEIVATVRKIIHVILNFRPSSLDIGKPGETREEPEAQLKTTIRGIILDLPNQIQQTASESQSVDRIVVFAKESLDMITRLTSVFSDQLEKADRWVGGDERPKTLQQVHSPLDSLDESLDTCD